MLLTYRDPVTFFIRITVAPTFLNISGCHQNKFIHSRNSDKVGVAGMVEARGYHRIYGSKSTNLKNNKYDNIPKLLSIKIYVMNKRT